MARFREAGLNPHLIYGKGTSGQASNVATPDAKGYSRAEAANVTRGLDLFGDFNQFQNIQAQTDNLEASSDLTKQNELLAAQKTANEAISGKKQGLDYSIAKELKETQIQAAKTNLEKLTHETKRSEAQATLETRSVDPRVNKIKQEVNNLLKQGDILTIKKKLLKWENSLKNYNLTPSDSPFLRLLHHIGTNMETKTSKSFIKP